MSHAESISLLFTLRGTILLAIVWCAFKPAQLLGRRRKRERKEKKKKRHAVPWLPLAIHFYVCDTFSGVPPQPLLYGCVINQRGNWPRDTFLPGLFFSQVRSPISLTAWPQRYLCQHSKKCSLLCFVTSPSPQKSNRNLKSLPSYSLRWNGKELGFRLCPPNLGGCIIITE